MTEGQGGRELTPREPAEVEPADSSVTPVDGDQRDVERFSAGPRAHSVGLTEERSAKIVRQSANARNVVFLALLAIALFIPVYWFYESGVPALGTEGRLAAEADVQYVTDVARGYELYIANCAECHGDTGQGGIGPRLNDQGKLYNVLTPAGDPGTGHLNPNYLDSVLTVGGRYICGDPDSLMAAWRDPDGPLNYRQIEELIAWLNASQDTVFPRHIESHGEAEEDHGDAESIAGWRDPNYEPGPDDTPVPACWKAPAGLVPDTGGGGTATPAPDGGGTTDPTEGGTPDDPRQILMQATSTLQFVDESGAPITSIEVTAGETIEFVIDNTAGFDHNFYIGTADALQVPFAETEFGIPTWQTGVETYTWTVPDKPIEDLQFACTVPGHYTLMHGDIVITAGATADDATDSAVAPDASADTETSDTQATDTEPVDTGSENPAGGTPEEPRVIDMLATSTLQFTDLDGAAIKSIDALPGETIEFVIDNTAGFDHNFYIGTADALQVPFGETEFGIPTWQTGVETYTWTVPEAGIEGLRFACTVPGHYTLMSGDIVISS